jgi:hypothetical protein
MSLQPQGAGSFGKAAGIESHGGGSSAVEDESPTVPADRGFSRAGGTIQIAFIGDLQGPGQPDVKLFLVSKMNPLRASAMAIPVESLVHLAAQGMKILRRVGIGQDDAGGIVDGGVRRPGSSCEAGEQNSGPQDGDGEGFPGHAPPFRLRNQKVAAYQLIK